MMNLNIYFDHQKGIRGRLCLFLSEPIPGQEKDRIVDQEVIVKHPFLLRLRMRAAVRRMKRRQAKIAKFMEIYNKENPSPKKEG